MSAAVGKAKKAPTGPARAPPASRRGKRQPTTEIHRLGADPGAEPRVLDHLVARLPSTHADGGNGSRAHRDRQGVVARLGRRRAHSRGAALVFSFARGGLRCLRLALQPHVEWAVGHLEVGLVHCVRIPASIGAFGLGWVVNWSVDFGFAYEDPLGLVVSFPLLLIPFVLISGATLRWIVTVHSATPVESSTH